MVRIRERREECRKRLQESLSESRKKEREETVRGECATKKEKEMGKERWREHVSNSSSSSRVRKRDGEGMRGKMTRRDMK